MSESSPAFCRQSQHERASDALSAAGDHRDLACQSLHKILRFNNLPSGVDVLTAFGIVADDIEQPRLDLDEHARGLVEFVFADR